MAFSILRTVGFRNLQDGIFDLNKRVIFFVGENGQGKTNILEALYVCAYGASFRAVKEANLIHEGSKEASVSVVVSGDVEHRVTIKFQGSKKTIFIDEKAVKSRKELLTVSPTIIFCHEDMEFISGSPERRRWFFDQTLSLYDPLYLEDLQRYRHILKLRNAVLKTGNLDTLESLNYQLIRVGIGLIQKRRAVSEQFSSVFSQLYEMIAGIEGLSLLYKPSWATLDFELILKQLKNIQERELLLKVSLSGPHRDRYLFIRNNQEFEIQASTGQRRLLALLLRIAQAKLFTSISGRLPVLLLDDVLLELDPEKRKKFFSFLPPNEQSFFTFLPEEPYERYQKGDTLVYHVRNGEIQS